MGKCGLLLTNICVLIILSGCVPHQINSISTITPQRFDDPCLEDRSSSSISISPTDIPSLSLDAVRSEIMSYLNSGGSASGLQPLILDNQNSVIGSIMEFDLNNDGIKEIILSTTIASEVDQYKAGWVGIYECQMGKYSASYAELGPFIEYAKVDAVRDLLDIGTPQIYVEYKWQGMGCQVGLQVLALSSDKWSWAFGKFLTCPATVSMSTNKTTGKTEIIYEGILRDVMGNEPDREVTQIFAAENGEFQLQP
jgi:hypothetical protein